LINFDKARISVNPKIVLKTWLEVESDFRWFLLQTSKKSFLLFQKQRRRVQISKNEFHVYFDLLFSAFSRFRTFAPPKQIKSQKMASI
jgi:hypothetical protein